MAGELSYRELSALLPHAHPMILLDRVLTLEPGTEICAIKAVTGSEPCYAGIPEGSAASAYVYPASLLVESFGQAAAILWLRSSGRRGDGDVLMFAAARNAEIEGDVYPGDVVRHVARLESSARGAAFVGGDSWIGDRRVARFGMLSAVVRPAKSLMPGGADASSPSPPRPPITHQGDMTR
jgi:3-hydroxyacyl-[acyl-carrier-protein] dehydratase